MNSFLSTWYLTVRLSCTCITFGQNLQFLYYFLGYSARIGFSGMHQTIEAIDRPVCYDKEPPNSSMQ